MTTTPTTAAADRPARAELDAMATVADLTERFAGDYRAALAAVTGTKARARVRTWSDTYAADALRDLLGAGQADPDGQGR
jgi:hypothetical protein